MLRKFHSVFTVKLLIWCLLSVIGTQSIRAEVVGDFDGDGKADFVVRRRDNQTTQLFWWILNSDGGHSVTQWGLKPGNGTISDDPISGDFDGDGKADIAVFRSAFFNPPIPSYFYILRSSDNTALAVQWGLSDDKPRCQDYDGDGITDIAVTRTVPLFPGGAMIWYMLQSRNGYQTAFIQKCCTSLPGDFDGDGRADFAVVYSEGTSGIYQHYIVQSRIKRAIFRTFGTNSDIFVPGDYDGDGKTDLATWMGLNNNVSGIWRWIRSSDGQIGSARLGSGVVNGDKPVPGDYDGDGKTDPAIFRQSGGGGAEFVILGSQRGIFTVPWGLGDDLP
jgi:hypothetical protein